MLWYAGGASIGRRGSARILWRHVPEADHTTGFGFAGEFRRVSSFLGPQGRTCVQTYVKAFRTKLLSCRFFFSEPPFSAPPAVTGGVTPTARSTCFWFSSHMGFSTIIPQFAKFNEILLSHAFRQKKPQIFVTIVVRSVIPVVW